MSEVNKSSKDLIKQKELRQKLYYFQSEAAKYKFLADKYELLLIEALKNKSNEIVLEENDQHKAPPIYDSISYFNYSIVQELNGENPFIYGSFTITNNGNEQLSTPVICLKINEPSLATIGGKIGTLSNSSQKLIGNFEEWIYVHQDWRTTWEEKGELWLKPTQTKKILPGEKLRFSGFDISIKNMHKLKTLTVEGYSYFEQIPNGQKSLNIISMKGV